MKKIVKIFVIGFLMLGLFMVISSTPNVEADFCELPPEGQPPSENCNILP